MRGGQSALYALREARPNHDHPAEYEQAFGADPLPGLWLAGALASLQNESEDYDGQLLAGHAREAFTRYLAVYPQCRTREEKILAIDRLIHEFHWFIMKEDQPARGNKPAAVNLLRGNIAQVYGLLNELTYGESTPPELLEGKSWWLEAQKRKPDQG